MKKYAFIDKTTIWTVEFKENDELEVNKILNKRNGNIESTPTDLDEFSRKYNNMAQKLVFQCLKENTIIIDTHAQVIIDQELNVTQIKWDEHQELLKLLTTLAI